MLKTIISLSVAIALTGCAAVNPTPMPTNLPGSNAKKALEHANSPENTAVGFNQVDPVEIQGQKDVILQAPTTIPEWIAKKRVTLKLQPGMSLKALAAYLGGYQNIPIVVSEGVNASSNVLPATTSTTTSTSATATTSTSSSSSNVDSANMDSSFFLPYYKGTMGEFFNIVGEATDTWITWKNGAITFSAREKVTIVVPQNEELLKQLQESIKTYGVNDVSYSLHAGLLTAKLKPSQYKEVKQMLESFVKNTAAVKLQVVVVTVSQDESVKQGMNWEQLQVAASSGGTLSTVFPSIKLPAASATGTVSTGTTGTTTTGTTGSTTGSTAATVIASTVGGVLANKDGATWGIIGKQFNLTGMINYLRTYGQAETSQNMMLQGITGSELVYKSVKEVPYVSEVSSTSVATTSTTTTGSTKTDKAKDGVTLKMLPRYDAESNIVSLKFNLSQQAVLGMVELSAGNQVGKLTQPSTSDSSLENSMLELRPGDAAIVGGMTFDSISRNNEAPLFLADTRAESKSLLVRRQTMYIVVMPYVSRLGKFREQINVPADDEKMKAASLQRPVKVVEIDAPEQDVDTPTQADPLPATNATTKKTNKKIIRKSTP